MTMRVCRALALISLGGLLAGCPTGIDLDVQVSGFEPDEAFTMAIAVAGYDVDEELINDDDIHMRCYSSDDLPRSIGIHGGDHYSRHVAVLAQVRMSDSDEEFFVHRTLGFTDGERVSAELHISGGCVIVACGAPPMCTSTSTPECDDSASPFPPGYEPHEECEFP